MREQIDFNNIKISDGKAMLTFNEVAAIALRARDLEAMIKLLKFGYVYIAGIAYFVEH